MDILGALWEQSPLFLTRAEFEKSLEGCTFDPVYVNGEAVAVFVVKGPEFHFAKFTDTPCSREHLRKYPGSLIAQYGYATTRTPKDDTRQQRFNERLGFRRYGEDEHDVLYTVTADTFRFRE